ncbi:MAG: cob(I)yrinic acid a,c-diamide adenosyltransferase [Candidatus Levybacteria bacterium]|nr:cob(I)yrinic acid a,c-diamide adenosyltransferase [Candidatus Levybacteria bacterium]
MSIYTRTGDKGKTGLFNGKRVLKSHKRVDTYGTIDELNSTIGVVVAQITNHKSQITKKDIGAWNLVLGILVEIQNDLLDIGSALAFPSSPPVYGLKNRAEEFETVIDEMTEKMPTLQNFILPGGGVVGATLHLARVAARKAERKIVDLMQKEEIDEQIVKYINRLSDLFFTMARYTNMVEKQKETIWRKK